MVPTIIRLILTVVLLYFVFLETGWATTLFAALSSISHEIDAMLMKQKRQ